MDAPTMTFTIGYIRLTHRNAESGRTFRANPDHSSACWTGAVKNLVLIIIICCGPGLYSVVAPNDTSGSRSRVIKPR